MNVPCPHCREAFTVPDQVLRRGVAKVTCNHCSFAFVIRLGDPGAAKPKRREPAKPIEGLKSSQGAVSAAGEIGGARPKFIRAETRTTVVIDPALRAADAAKLAAEAPLKHDPTQPELAVPDAPPPAPAAPPAPAQPLPSISPADSPTERVPVDTPTDRIAALGGHPPSDEFEVFRPVGAPVAPPPGAELPARAWSAPPPVAPPAAPPPPPAAPPARPITATPLVPAAPLHPASPVPLAPAAGSPAASVMPPAPPAAMAPPPAPAPGLLPTAPPLAAPAPSLPPEPLAPASLPPEPAPAPLQAALPVGAAPPPYPYAAYPVPVPGGPAMPTIVGTYYMQPNAPGVMVPSAPGMAFPPGSTPVVFIEVPPGYGLPQPTSRGMKIFGVFMSLVLILGTLFFLFVLYQNSWSLDLANFGSMVARAFGGSAKPSSGSDKLRGLDITSPIVAEARLSSGERVVTAEGAIKNDDTRMRRYLYVRASILDNHGRRVASVESPAGNMFSKEELSTLSRTQLNSHVNPAGKDGRNAKIAPGDNVAYMVVITEVPADFSRTKYRVIAEISQADVIGE